MAKPKLKKEQINRYLSFIDPMNTAVSVDSDDDDTEFAEAERVNTQPGNKGINNLASTLRRQGDEYVSSTLAGGSTTLPAANLTQKSNATQPQTNIPRPPASIMLGNEASRIMPLLSNNADLGRVARSVITDFDISDRQAPAATSTAPDVATTTKPRAIEQSPEDKLLAALANTNPAPNSFFRRLLAGAVRGASQVTGQDTPATAFGKVAGNVIARSFPAVDSALQYDENVERAKQRYSIESAGANARLSRRKAEADIQDADTRRIQAIEDRAERRRQSALLDSARLRDDKRAEAKLRLDALKDLPEDSPQRDEIANELRASFGINIDRNYGVKADKEAAKLLTESDVAKRAESEVLAEIGASVEKIARDSTNNKPHIIAARDEMNKVLNDPKASNVKKAQARESYEKLYATELKTNIDYTRSDVESRIRKREGELRGTAKPRATKSNSKGNKVQASNEAKATNFAGTKLRFR